MNGDIFSLILPYSDAAAMQVFIDEFSKHLDGQYAVLIMDQAPWHKTSKISIPENIILIFQPAYSPELNPVEHFWEYLREKYMANHYFRNMDELEDCLCDALRECSSSADIIKSLALFDWMVYE